MERFNSKKRVAVIGFGGMGAWHVSHLQNSDVAELAGIWDIDPTRRAAAAGIHVPVYDSFSAVLEDPTVDILTLAVPNELHMPMAIEAMEAGKHVISEKPVTMSSQELSLMIDASVRTNRLFTTHQNRRWDADYLMVKNLYASGELGPIFGIESRVQGSHGIPGDWRGRKEHGGGMILDWGVHLIDQMVGIVYDRKVQQVYCRCDHVTNYEVDDGFRLDLYFEGGLTARIEVGTSHFISLPRFYVTGENGSALIGGWKDDCHIVACTNRTDKDVIPVATAAGLTKTMAPRSKETIREWTVPRPSSDVHDFYRNVCLAIDKKAEQLVTHAQLMRVMRIMEAAFRSDELGVPVAIDDEIC